MLRSIIFLLSFIISYTYANGVLIVDASNPTYLTLLESNVEIDIENQVAITKTTQTFLNDLGEDTQFKYAFPLNEQASAINLRWQIHETWFQASFSATPQDTSLPSSGEDIDHNLALYLGETPLYFTLTDTLKKDSLIVFELTYVELLPYEFGTVTYTYPNNYQLIQNSIVNFQELTLSLSSERIIESIDLIDFDNEVIENDGNTADLNLQIYESPANQDYTIVFSLNLKELGLFGLSTFLPDSTIPDQGSRGFFIFVAEPDPSQNTEVINKVFTLIIDRSGSMSGDKIVQARNAASFIVEHLNEGDKFNIVDFATNVNSFQSGHVEYNPSTESTAINYISLFNATGSTNISGAFSTAVQQFSVANDSTANIIIFFTDGEATTGITDTPGILNHVENLITSAETNLNIFTFGIGSSVNEQLLTLLATQNGGLVEFLKTDELEDRITNFYLKIQNPVLLNTAMSFSSQVINETYPTLLPNLYKGQQMIVAGRYSEGLPTSVTLSGDAYGQPLEYNYDLSLADSAVGRYQFLTKIWAKKKIESLLILYYSYNPGSEEAEEIMDVIIFLSLNFGIVTPFTSFSEGDPTTIEETGIEDIDKTVNTFTLLGNYPNPFNSTTTIKFIINKSINGIVKIRLYNTVGQLIRILYVSISGKGEYTVFWDGTKINNSHASTGTYFYIIDFQDNLIIGKMTLLK